MRNCVLAFSLLFIAISGFAQELVVSENNMENIGRNLQSQYIQSCGAPDDLDYSAFKKIEAPVPQFEGSDGCYWYTLDVKNNSGQNLLILEIYNPSIDEVTLFEHQADGSYKERKQGRSIAHKFWEFELPNILFEINAEQGSSKQMLLRVRNKEQFSLPVNIGPKDRILQGSFNNQILFGIYAGIMMVMFFYNLFLYFSVRDRSYLFYVAHTILVLLTQAAFFGFGFLYIWPEATGFAEVSFVVLTCLVSIAGIRFFFEFLRVKRYTPTYYFVFRVVEVIYLLIIILEVSGFRDFAYKVLLPIQSMVALGIFIVSLNILLKGYRPARIYLLSWTVLLIGILIFALKDFNVLPYNYLTLHTIQIGSALEAILLSFALANRINILKKEKEESQAQALSILKENEKMIKEQNIVLEKKVQERTMEIQEANEELQSTLTNLKEAQSQLVDAEKMASLGQLTAGIAHEINNPINFVTSNINPLRRDLQDIYEIIDTYGGINTENPKEEIIKAHELRKELDYEYLKDEIGTLVDGIFDGAKRTQEIVKGLRTFSRLDEDVVKLADLNEGLESTLVILQNKIRNSILVEKDYDEDLRAVECYPGKLNQVFMNILNNAVYAVEKKIYADGEEPKITIQTTHTDDKDAVISIKDNGIGMSETTRKKVFEPFYTTKDVGEGTGLGMSIVFKIIERHHGRIEIKSEEGIGTEFIITLPVSQPKEDKE